MRPWFFIFLLTGIFMASCSGGSTPIRENQSSTPAEYRFNYAPYDTLSVTDKDVRNYVFNVVRNKLIYYVEKTINTRLRILGMIFELNPQEGVTRFNDIVESRFNRGWVIMDNDIIPFADSDISEINSGNVSDEVARSPKAGFYLDVKGNQATVMVRYWIMEYRNYNYVYYLENHEGWKIVRIE